MGSLRGAGDTAKEQRLGHLGGGQVRVREGGEKANEVPHGQANVEAEGREKEGPKEGNQLTHQMTLSSKLAARKVKAIVV